MSSKKQPRHFYLERDVIELLESLSEENHLPMSTIVNRALYFTYYADMVRLTSGSLFLSDPDGYGNPFAHSIEIYDKCSALDLYGQLDTYFETALWGCAYFPDPEFAKNE